jgi:hypothetical protein
MSLETTRIADFPLRSGLWALGLADLQPITSPWAFSLCRSQSNDLACCSEAGIQLLPQHQKKGIYMHQQGFQAIIQKHYKEGSMGMLGVDGLFLSYSVLSR